MNTPLVGEASSGPTFDPLGLAALLRDLFRGGLAGLLCGVVFFGFGSRVVMRLSAMLNPERRGILTENGNVVGEITVAGTLELLLFGGVFGGLLAGFIWVIVRDWLPSSGAPRVLLAGVAAACLGSFSIFTEENLDFRILSPAWLHLAMFLLLVGIAGSAIALADPVLANVLPRGPAIAVVYAVLAIPVGLVALSVLLQALLEPKGVLWAVAVALLAVLVVDLLHWRARYLGGGSHAWLWTAGVGGVVAACAAAALHFAIEAEAILRGSL